MTNAPYIRGEFGPGSMGPTICMVLSSQSAAEWLRGLFLSMIGSEGLVDLAACDEVELHNIEALQLTRVDRRHGAQLSKHRRKNTFLWQCDDEEWQTNAELIDPFVAGHTGDQHLTQGGVDDAVVKISFGDPEVRVPGT